MSADDETMHDATAKVDKGKGKAGELGLAALTGTLPSLCLVPSPLDGGADPLPSLADALPWVEKYRPATLDDVVAHKDIIATSCAPLPHPPPLRLPRTSSR